MIPLHYAPEVLAALEAEQPVVALESTIITHGLPAPQNREAALALEKAVRAGGATPATIAVLDGQIHIGLSAAELDRLVAVQNPRKLSRADLAVALSQGLDGATTVAATLICARLAGISVFATGGIGGVHRGAESSFDISADLLQLAESPVSVVSAGAKAILDLPKTLEVLESYGVPVIAVGQDQFPAFWSRESGLTAPLRLDSAREIAAAHLMRANLRLPGGQLIANPIPEAEELPRAQIAPIIERALKLADQQQISGKALTPFVLQQIYQLTKGRSLRVNLALALNNARLGAEIAIEICKQGRLS